MLLVVNREEGCIFLMKGRGDRLSSYPALSLKSDEVPCMGVARGAASIEIGMDDRQLRCLDAFT
jgi:hypothetical protein